MARLGSAESESIRAPRPAGRIRGRGRYEGSSPPRAGPRRNPTLPPQTRGNSTSPEWDLAGLAFEMCDRLEHPVPVVTLAPVARLAANCHFCPFWNFPLVCATLN